VSSAGDRVIAGADLVDEFELLLNSFKRRSRRLIVARGKGRMTIVDVDVDSGLFCHGPIVTWAQNFFLAFEAVHVSQTGHGQHGPLLRPCDPRILFGKKAGDNRTLSKLKTPQIP
jgi:hypothetical protein